VIRVRLPIQRHFRPPRRWSRLAHLLWLWPALAAAQPAAPPTAKQSFEVRLAANERMLWLAVVSESESRLFTRTAGGDFDLGYPIKGRIAFMAAAQREPLIFFDDGQSYCYSAESRRLRPARNLPADQQPVDVVGNRDVIYAIIPSSAARELSPTGSEGAEPTSQQLFDPGDAPLSLAVYDGHTWSAVAPLPALVRPPTSVRLRPQLCLVQDKLLLFAPAEQSGSILCFYHDAEKNQWSARGTMGGTRLTGFWALIFDNRPTLVTVSPGPSGGERIDALRLLDDAAEATATDWRAPEDLQLSELPPGTTVARYERAVGFNQHVGLLTIAGNGNAYLRFARIASAPAEQTRAVAGLLAEPALAVRMHGLLQMLTFILLLVVLTGLFVFRRGSMLKVVELPPGCALAFNLQRLFGWLIDFVPFALAAAAMLDVSWSEGLKSLTKWAISPAEENLPKQQVLLWWALTVSGHTTYTLVMELLTRRTVGKVLARVYLMSESGARPTIWQVLTRNLTRLIELSMPTLLWIVAVLILLSRNHQRMGDIFARTIAIRLTSVQPRSAGDTGAGASGDESAVTTRDDSAKPPDSEGGDAPSTKPPEAETDESAGTDSDEDRSSAPRDP
jgi:uncharacterized RDD family membrane protein YckC